VLRRYRNIIIGLAVFLLLLCSLRFVHVGARQETDKEHAGETALISMDKRAIRPDDGDTFFYKGLAIRILGVDAPEIIHEQHGIFENQPYGRRAAEMTVKVLSKAKVIEYLPFQNDRYGRLLAHVFVDGALLSVILIKAGLAYENVSYYGDNGFPDLAERILKASKEYPRPPFEEPYKWRRRHQIKK
jgi:endonuclease YncB( thermonuclease family)